MRLLTHNMLRSNMKGVEKGYPLKIEAAKVETKESEFNSDLMKNLLSKLDLDALREAAATLELEPIPPNEEITDEKKEDESFLRLLHRVLLEIHVMEGALICPESGRRFPVKDGIPNMLLHEDEV